MSGVSVAVSVNDEGGEGESIGEHAFSASAQTENASMLSDAGQSRTGLSYNARLLGVNAVGLSHGHYDHTGGLPAGFHSRTDLPDFLGRLPRFASFIHRW